MMDEYIKKETAYRAIMGERPEAREPSWFAELVLEIPAADVVEVVRCRDCKHWKPSGSKGGKSFSDMEYIGCCKFANCCRRESDFCSLGERKNGGE